MKSAAQRDNEIVYLDELTYTTSRKHLSDLVNSLVEYETNIDSRKFNDKLDSCHKPIAAKLGTVTFKERYKREHESELILFKAAEKSLLPYMKDGKAPLIKELRAEQQALYAEKDKLYKLYGSAKSQQKELDVIMKNVDMLIGKDNSQEREAQRKRLGELE